MSILDTITARFRRNVAAAPAQIETPATTTQEMPEPRSFRPVVLGDPFKVEKGRTALIKATEAMYEEDPRIRRVVTDYASDVVARGFTVKVNNSPQAEAAAAALGKRLGLNAMLDDWMRKALRCGDVFIENGVDAKGQIALATVKPSLEMRRNTNRFDLFDDPAAAYIWVGDLPTFGKDIPDGSVPFAQWQIIHGRWDHDSGKRYGFPLFGAATRIYKYVTDGENNMAIRRKVRSGMRIGHKVEGGPQAVEEYRKNNADVINDPYVAIAEYIGNSTITAIQGDANLNQFEDVMHHVRTLGFASPLTLNLLGYGQDLNRDVLDQQQRQYDKNLIQTRNWLEDQIVKPLVHLQWLLDGIYPENVDYQIVWDTSREPSLGEINAAAELALKLQMLGVDPVVIEQLLQRYVPGLAQASTAMQAREAAASAIDKLIDLA